MKNEELQKGIIIGRLQVLLEENDEALNDVAQLEEAAMENNRVKMALFIGRLEIRVSEGKGKNEIKTFKEAFLISNGTLIEEIDFSPKLRAILRRHGIVTIEDLAQKSKQELKKMRHFGDGMLNEVIQKCQGLGIEIKE